MLLCMAHTFFSIKIASCIYVPSVKEKKKKDDIFGKDCKYASAANWDL